MELTYRNNRFEFGCTFHEKEVARTAGFRWDPKKKVWYTERAVVAQRLSKYADSDTIKEMENTDEPKPCLTFDEGRERFEFVSTIEWKDIPKTAGFRWDGKVAYRWWTTSLPDARKLNDYADDSAKAKMAEMEATIEASRSADVDIELPVPEGLNYFPFQKAGIQFASSRPNTLIADEMGLGKTIQALGVVNTDPSIKSVLIVCPASLKTNWKREAEKWLTRPMTVGVANSKDGVPETDIVVINYDILKKFAPKLSKTWDLLVADECHYAKNYKAQRSKALYSIEAKRRIFLTGTPILNRPSELFPIINALDSQSWPKFFAYGMKYCAGKNTRYGWDFTGASNLDDLQERLRSTVMIRRLKSQVLKELPPKTRQVIEMPTNGHIRLVKAEQKAVLAQEELLAELRVRVELAKASEDPEVYKNAVQELKDACSASFEEISRLRHETALAKVDLAIDHLKNMLDSTDKIVVFAHHKDVVSSLMDGLSEFNPVKLTGDMDQDARQESVDRFQNDDSCRIFVGSILAAGVGLTLTASSTVVFIELDWVPANMSQAEDRCHRIGQTHNVLVQHLVLEGSLDAHLAQTLVSKQNVIDQALDTNHQSDDVEAVDSILEAIRNVHLKRKEEAEKEEGLRQQIKTAETVAATKMVRQEAIEKQAAQLTSQQIKAIHTALQMLANVCDFAMMEDGCGFNKIDAGVGHSLAAQESLTPRQAVLGRSIVMKYHRQIPSNIYKVIVNG